MGTPTAGRWRVAPSPRPLEGKGDPAFSYKYGAKSMMDSPAFRGIRLFEGLARNVKKTAERPTSSKAYADLFKSLVDVAAFSLGTGDVRRMYETAAQGWEDMESGKTVNPFRLFFRKPKK